MLGELLEGRLDIVFGWVWEGEEVWKGQRFIVKMLYKEEGVENWALKVGYKILVFLRLIVDTVPHLIFYGIEPEDKSKIHLENIKADTLNLFIFRNF